MQHEIVFRLVLEHPPNGVDFALQKGRGSAYECIQKQRSNGKDLQFEFVLTPKTGKHATPDFTGPLVQGPPGKRFVYLDIGTYAGQTDSCWSRRLKVPLSGISRAMLEAPVGLEMRIPGTGKDGGPNCGTLKPFMGWKLRSR
jgi:Family of unknown function (DUF5990)